MKLAYSASAVALVLTTLAVSTAVTDAAIA